jgi:beta-N-acetylhexosaminidase
VAEGALKSFQAGADILLICKDQERVRESLELMRGALSKGTITEARLDQSLGRISQMKKRFLGRQDEISLAGVREYFKIRA